MIIIHPIISQIKDLPDLPLSGWDSRKQFILSGSSDGNQNNYVHTINVHASSGVDDSENVYIGAGENFQNIRFTKSDGLTVIPFTVLRITGNTAIVSIGIDLLLTSGGSFFLYYNKSKADSIYKIAFLTDIHYDPLGTGNQEWRTYTLTNLGQFVTRMQSYLPDLAINAGDKIGTGDTTEATQLSWYQSTLDGFASVASYAGDTKDGVSPGNHDFDYMQFSNVIAKHSSESWMESGAMYGYWESDDYRFISLDANYKDSDDTHHSLSYNGYGYIQPAQLTWLTNTLSSSTKPCIVFCHQLLCEADTDQFTLTKEIYHVVNRVAVRGVLEASNKVILVVHGHMHYWRNDIINGIPYAICPTIANTGSFGELPLSNNGQWSLLELSKDNKTVTFIRERYTGAGYEAVYRQILPFGEYIEAENAEAVYNDNMLRGAVQFEYTLNSRLYIGKYPRNLNTPDPYLSDRTLRIEGRDTDGKAQWKYSSQTGKFALKFSIRFDELQLRYILLGADDVDTNRAVYIRYNLDGTIDASNGLTIGNVSNYIADTWYDLQIISDVALNTFTFSVNGIAIAENYNFRNAVSELTKMQLQTDVGNMYIDQLRLEKELVDKPSIISWN